MGVPAGLLESSGPRFVPLGAVLDIGLTRYGLGFCPAVKFGTAPFCWAPLPCTVAGTLPLLEAGGTDGAGGAGG